VRLATTLLEVEENARHEIGWYTFLQHGAKMQWLSAHMSCMLPVIDRRGISDDVIQHNGDVHADDHNVSSRLQSQHEKDASRQPCAKNHPVLTEKKQTDVAHLH